ncbi:DUF192 domain-containing protein [Anaerotignum sp.]|uniref:DUF192 domain-containing protein n=1 Tax=Anaerotignum sp. TaxID=2039241 RepID=UPI002714A53A|nr:DUF192 domain-containing protein [Anaerotignum sp.]
MLVYCNNIVLADKVRIANNFFSRFVGLMGRKKLDSGEGLFLLGTPSIHCFFMKITIDAIYLSKDMKVLGVETLRPWRMGKYMKKTAHVLELKEGTALNVRVGDRIVLEICS